MRTLVIVLPLVGCLSVDPPTTSTVEGEITSSATPISPVDTGTLRVHSPINNCTATLLSNTWAVTAAHCVLPNTANATVTMGLQDSWVAEVINLEFTDLAVLRLGWPIRMFGSDSGYVMNYFAASWSRLCCGVPNRTAQCRGYGAGTLAQTNQRIINYNTGSLTMVPTVAGVHVEAGDFGGTCTVANAHGEQQMLGVLTGVDPFNEFEAEYIFGDRDGRAWIAQARLGYRLQMRHSFLSLGVAGQSQADGARIQQQPTNVGTNQHQIWRIVPVGGPGPVRYAVHAAHSGKCLTVDAANNALVQATCEPFDTYQRWNIVFDGETYALTNEGAANACIDTPSSSMASGEGMQVFPCHNGSNQKLYLSVSVPDGAFEIGLNEASIDVPGWSTTIGDDIQQFPRNSGSNQFFRFERGNYGYRIKPKYANLCFGLENNASADGTRIELQACSDRRDQQFNLTLVPSYSQPKYWIVHSTSGKCLEGASSSPAAQKLILRTCNAAVQRDSRVWVLRP